MTKNNQRYKQKDAQLLGGNITDTELGQELGSIHQAISQLSQNFSQLLAVGLIFITHLHDIFYTSKA
ncbi:MULTISPECIES: hypothetical protein [Priestia]|uniref:hypothetical protein n=1 Tax=Priestia TaxID=2800373 RepID=UPI000BEDD218|nr:hypothetical protein [Priestia megaterium]MDW4511578.1 hypothetical protein [Priestia megaterium]PEC46478.1 hypothetical protein CON11_02505 [Priestia megaterium]